MMKKIILNVFQVTALIIWFSVSGYFGTAGYTKLKIDELIDLGRSSTSEKSYSVGKLTFSNSYYMEAYLEEKKATKYFPAFFLDFPNILVLLLTACSFGVLGGLTFMTKRMAIDGDQLTNLKVISLPLLGALTGVIVLGIATTTPVLLVSGDSDLRPLTLVFLCFFGGFYNTKFFDWLNGTIGNLFLSNNSN